MLLQLLLLLLLRLRLQQWDLLFLRAAGICVRRRRCRTHTIPGASSLFRSRQHGAGSDSDRRTLFFPFLPAT